jgi:hypothetical protein
VALTFAFWQDPALGERSERARLVFAFLVSCRQSDEVPGLMEMGAGTIAEMSRLPFAAVEEALAELEAHKFIEVDSKARLVRVPKAPRYAPPINPNHLDGIFRRWRKLPASPLRMRHVEAIREACVDKDWYATAWAKTFGTVEDNTASFQASEPVDTVPPTVGVTVPPTVPPTVSERWGEPPKIQIQKPDPETSPDPDARGKRRRLDALGGHRPAAVTLWLKQDALRAEAIQGARPLRATDEALRRVAERLGEGYSVEDCEHVLAIYAAEARKGPESARWFNGETNWRRENFTRALGQTIAPPRIAAGSTSPVSREPSEASKEIERLAEQARHRKAEESRAPPGNPMSLVTGLAGVLRGGNR